MLTLVANGITTTMCAHLDPGLSLRAGKGKADPREAERWRIKRKLTIVPWGLSAAPCGNSPASFFLGASVKWRLSIYRDIDGPFQHPLLNSSNLKEDFAEGLLAI